MGCLRESIFKYTLINLLKIGCLLGEYFQVHPYKSIEDGLMGEYFQVHPYKSIEDGLPWESIFKYTLINLLKMVASGRVFSSTPL